MHQNLSIMDTEDKDLTLGTENGSLVEQAGGRPGEQLSNDHQNQYKQNHCSAANNPTGVHIEISDEAQMGESGRKNSGVKQFRLRRALSDVHFRAHLAKVHPDKKDYSKWGTVVLAFQTLGVVFGGLGTSPLYVWPTIQLDNPNEDDFLGVMSLLFWTVTLIALVKYGLIILNADDHGEGGTFALYSLLCQHAKIGQRLGDPSYFPLDESSSSLKLEGTRSRSSFVSNRLRSFLENRKGAQFWLFFVVMFGTCLVIGDGILTPAISVLSAMAGIQGENSAINSSVVTWVSAAILVLLFLLQRFGTHRIGILFSPIMLVWFVSTPLVGIYNIVTYYPGVFKALSPHYIIQYFQQNQKNGWVALGGVVLCVTGAEAAFADMGHFNKRSIQIAFVAVIYPSAILTYAGETAYLIKNPGDHQNAFFKSLPRPVYWPMFVVATLAAIVASQSLITATFSIIKQSVALGAFPRVKMVHTSATQEGQVYSPEVNYILMVLCLAVVLGFRDATQVGNAFGVAVIGVMFISSTLLTMVMLLVWNLSWPLALLYFCIYGSIEGIYFSAVLNKLPQGGWFPFAIALVFMVISLCWNYGRQKKYAYEMDNKISLDNLGNLLSSAGIQRVPGICFFYSDLAHGIPPIITHYVRNVRTLHQVLILTTIRFLPVKTVSPDERFHVSRVGFKGVYRCVVQYGYQDVINCKDGEFRNQAIRSLRLYLAAVDKNELTAVTGNSSPSMQLSVDAYNAEDLREIERASEQVPVYVVGKVTVKTSSDTNWLGRLAIEKVYALLRIICRSAIKELRISPESYLEVGMLYEI